MYFEKGSINSARIISSTLTCIWLLQYDYSDIEYVYVQYVYLPKAHKWKYSLILNQDKTRKQQRKKNIQPSIMTSTTEPKETATTSTATMSRVSTMWDQAEKGFLTDAERIAKNMDVEGKGHLSRDQAVALGAQYQSLKEDNTRIKNQLYGLALLCVVLFMGTVAGTVIAIKNSKDTIVDMKTGVMKVNDGAGGGMDIVTVKAQGTTFKTIASFEVEEDIVDSEMNQESTGTTVTSYCVSGEDVASMWVANEEGSDARLVLVNDDGIINEDDDEDDTEISRIQPVTIGPATWKKDRIVMGGMIFTANEECSNAVRRKRRRMLLQENNHDIEEDNRQSLFDPILIHRALKQRVDFLTTGRGGHRHGRDLLNFGEWIVETFS